MVPVFVKANVTARVLSALLADEDAGRCIRHRLRRDSPFHEQQARLFLEEPDRMEWILGVHRPGTVLVSGKGLRGTVRHEDCRQKSPVRYVIDKVLSDRKLSYEGETRGNWYPVWCRWSVENGARHPQGGMHRAGINAIAPLACGQCAERLMENRNGKDLSITGLGSKFNWPI